MIRLNGDAESTTSESMCGMLLTIVRDPYSGAGSWKGDARRLTGVLV